MGKRTNTAKWDDKRNYWKINVQKDGQRRSFYSSAPGRTGQREANAKADAWLDDNISNENRRIELFLGEYIEDTKSRTSKSNWINEESRCRNWIKPTIGHLKLSAVTDQHLQNIINKAHKAGLSEKSLKNIRATLMAFFKFCRKCKATKFFPEDIIIPKNAPVGVRKIVQPESLAKLFSTDTTLLRGKIVPDEFVNAYRFQVLTGLRPGELLGLKWQDIQNGQVHLQRSINVYGEETKGKNKNAVRTFALGKFAASVLEAQHPLSGDDEFVFPGLMEQGYLKRWRRYCEANGIPKTTLYELRHTFVSAVQDLPESYVKGLVGHSKNMDTFGVYGHELTGQKLAVAEKVDKIFGEIIVSPEGSAQDG